MPLPVLCKLLRLWDGQHALAELFDDVMVGDQRCDRICHVEFPMGIHNSSTELSQQ